MAKVAKDYLAIQGSSVYLKEVSPYSNQIKNALNSDTVKTLMCLKSWFEILYTRIYQDFAFDDNKE